MSHITTYALSVKIGNENWLKKSIEMLESQFRGIRFEQKNANLIMVRYSGIEQYQKDGNMRFERNQATGEWVMKYDGFATQGEADRVRDAFVVAYQAVVTSAFFAEYRYSQFSQIDRGQVVVTGTRW
jgi:hypothetical protein